MSSDFKQFIIGCGVAENTSLVYISTLRSGIRRKNLSKVRGWSAASRWAAKYALANLSEDDTNLVGTLFDEEESETQDQETVIVKVIDESTIHDLVGILSMSIDDPNKLSMIKAYVDGRSMQLSTLRVQ